MSAVEAVRLGKLDAHEQAGLLRTKAVSPAELVEAAIIRIELLDPTINAVSYRAFEYARHQALRAHPDRGPFSGVPYLLKDSLHYPGMPARAASRSIGEAPPAEASQYVRRLDRAGLIPVGKSSMAEFGLLVSNEPLRYGPTNNPWDLARSPGGSSGGAAAAVAAGMVPWAHGSDAAGSIRVPAAVCGLVGFKPSRGAHVRARGVHWLDDMLCSDGMIARSVRDVAASFALVTPLPSASVARFPKRRLHIKLVMQGLNGASPEPEVADALHRTAELCVSLGHVVEEAEQPPANAALLDDLLDVLWPFLGLEAVERCLTAGQVPEKVLEPWAIALAQRCGRNTPDSLENALGAFERACRANFELLDGFDVLLSPTVAQLPVATGALAPTVPYDCLARRFAQFSPYTPLQNLAGTPAISLPLFASREGLPIGAMFAAHRHKDELLLALALELEAALPWRDRWPDLPQ